MAWVYADRVLDTSVTAGTGALTLSGTSPTGWRTFSTVCAVADTFYYTVHDPVTGAWETGEGTYSALNTVARTTVRQSSNANALVTFAANPKNVFIDVIGYYFGNIAAPLASPAFTGTPTAPTAPTATNTTQVATTAYVQANLTAELSVPTGALAYGDAAGTVGVTGVTTELFWDVTNKEFGVGTATPISGIQLRGVGGNTATPSVSTALGATLYVQNNTTTVGDGGMVMFGCNAGPFASLKAYAVAGASGDLIVGTKRLSTDVVFAETARFKADGSTVLAGALTGTSATFTGTVSAPGAQIQMVSVETGAVATGTTVIPYDDTIPQITEGDQFMTLAITPKSATSKLVIEVVAVASSSIVTVLLTTALFQDSTANALAAAVQILNGSGAGQTTVLSLRHVMTSGTTSATTFRVRIGGNSASTTTFNGQSGTRLFGGVMASSIVIREVL